MNSIFIRAFFPILAAFLIFMTILFFVFSTGVGISVAQWESEQQEETTLELQARLSGLFSSRPDPQDMEIRNTVMSLISDNGYILIFDNAKKLLFAYRNQTEQGWNTGLKWGENYLAQHPDSINYIPFYATADSLMYFAYGETGKQDRRGTAALVNSINATLQAGIIAAVVMASAFAYLFSRSLARRTGRLLNGVKQIAAGNLEYRIPETGVKELALIAASVNSLGRKLNRERSLRSQWTQDITHDIRTPLSALRAQLEGMRDGLLDTSGSRINILLGELARIETLAGDFNELIGLESPEMSIQRESIEAKAFTDELAGVFSLPASKKQISIKKDIRTGTFTGDRILLFRAMTNLLSNAVMYADEGSSVCISIAQEQDTVLLSVFNSGRNIPEKDLPHVFDRLYRGDYARNAKGSGLGLSITKKIAELHGGTVSINSKKDIGTTVTISLPQSNP